MFFDGYEQYKTRSINPALLWKYDLAGFDYQSMHLIVVQRVLQRGWVADWYAILNIYGVKQAIKDLAYLNEKDMHFVSLVFDFPFNEMKCSKTNSQCCYIGTPD